jgi:hypothetical protein
VSDDDPCPGCGRGWPDITDAVHEARREERRHLHLALADAMALRPEDASWEVLLMLVREWARRDPAVRT